MAWGRQTYQRGVEPELRPRSADEELAELLGMPPEIPEFQREEFSVSPFERGLENLAGAGIQPMGRPASFGEGLVGGLVGGLAGRGQRVAQRRQQFDQDQVRQQANVDAERRLASRDYRKERIEALRKLSGEEKDERTKRRTYEDANPKLTPEDIQQFPYLARLADSDGRIPRSVYADAIKPKEAKEAPFRAPVVIEGPNGPMYVSPQDAIGKTPGKVVGEPKPKVSTGEQKLALGFYNRGKEALGVLDMKDKGGRSLEDRIANTNPVAAAFGQRTINILKGDDRQRYEQAQKAFTQAKLRRESGAAISAQEYESDALTYFAQPGDSPGVIANKKRAREGVLEGLRFGAGPAYEEFYGEAPPPTGGAASRVPTPAPYVPKPGKAVRGPGGRLVRAN